MPRHFYFITHPNVVVSRDVPVPEWPLSDLGRARMRAALRLPWIGEVTAVYSSTEQKAVDGAAILAAHLQLPFTQVPGLGENDRSSTGFLPPAEFEATADLFFAQPEASVRGWERAVDAQARVVQAVWALAAAEQSSGVVAIVSHGAVGTLLYCHLTQQPITRRFDQPANGGGNCYRFTVSPAEAHSGWQAVDG
jgi:broad specificity phosphatase PhoE